MLVHMLLFVLVLNPDFIPGIFDFVLIHTWIVF